MQLEYLGEKFDRSNCNKKCDNCLIDKSYEENDYIKEFKTIMFFLINFT